MIGYLVGRTNCAFGRHHRSRALAKSTDEGTVSRCSYCKKPMQKVHGKKGWSVIDRVH